MRKQETRKAASLCFAANAGRKFLSLFQKRGVAVYFSKEPLNFLNRGLFHLSPDKLLHHSLAYFQNVFINLSIMNQLGLKRC